MGTVDFADYFWGERNDGFQVLMQNLKSSLLACKELGDFVKETSLIFEQNTKAYARMSKQLSSNLNYGTYSPILTALKTCSEKLSSVHNATLNKVNELLKEILRYSEDLHKKHKQIKDEESATSEVVKSLQETSSLLYKHKEFYKSKQQELEKVKRDNQNSKDVEKVEAKVKKAQEDYRTLVEKYSVILDDFEIKMASSCKHFQQAETLYLTQMIDFTQTYIDNLDENHNEIGTVNLEVEQGLVQNTVESMLEQFVLQKHTGLVKPSRIEFTEVIKSSGGPPSDISDRSGNSDRLSVTSMSKKELSTGGTSLDAVLQSEDREQDPSDTSSPMASPSSGGGGVGEMELNGSGSNHTLETGGKGGPPQVEINSGGMRRISTTRSNPTLVIDSPVTTSATTTSTTSLESSNRSPYASLAGWSVPGFLKSRKKKEKGKRKNKDENLENEHKELGSDAEEHRKSQTPTPDQWRSGMGLRGGGGGGADSGEGGGSGSQVATDPWADMGVPHRNFNSSSDSDSDEEMRTAIKVNIKPVANNGRSATSASVDELQKAITGIDLAVSTLPSKRMTPTVDFESGVKRSQSSNLVSNKDILSLYSNLDTASDVSGGAPGAESTRLDTSDISSQSNKEVSNILKDINDQVTLAVTETTDPPEQAPPSPPSTTPPILPPLLPTHRNAWPEKSKGGLELSFPPATAVFTASSDPLNSNIGSDKGGESGDTEPGTTPAPPGSTPAPPGSTPAPPPWVSSAAWGADPNNKEESSWAKSWADPVQPALPPKQSSTSSIGSNRPSSVQRDKIASSLISLPRPPSRARPEPRLRGTPSPTPSSILQTTALSLARSDSVGSSGSDRYAVFSASKTRSESLGSKQDGLSELLKPSRSVSHGIGPRAGPLMPAPTDSDTSRNRSRKSLSESPPPPLGAAPTLTNSRGASPLPHPSSGTRGPSPLPHPSSGTRGPSPLTLSGAEVVPLAVAFQEVVHAAFRGRDETRCMVKQLGDMMVSFPAGIVSVLASNPYPAPLQFRIKNSGKLESVLPNKQLITKLKNLCTPDMLVFEFNMVNLQELLNKQILVNPAASYFNIDILKYQITPDSGAKSCPIQMVSYWKCEDDHTDLRLDYKYNQYAMARLTPLSNLTLAVPVDGGVVNMTSQPKGSWHSESQRAMWKLPELNATQNNGVGSIRARFQLSRGPGAQGTVAAQFNCEGTTLSGVEFELAGSGYRVSLVKRRFVSGKYICEGDPSEDNNRYAAPPSNIEY